MRVSKGEIKEIRELLPKLNWEEKKKGDDRKHIVLGP